MATADTEVRWTSEEYRTVAKAMVPHLRKGHTLCDSIILGQSALERERQQPPEKFRTSASICTKFRTKLVEFRLMPKTEVQAITDQQSGKVFWTPVEWALIARRVKYWRETLKDRRKPNRIILSAAEIELAPNRQRPITSLSCNTVAGNEKRLAAALKKPGVLSGLPFDPNRTAYEANPQRPSKVTEFIDESKIPDSLIEAPETVQAAPKPAAPAPAPATAAESAEALTFTITAGPAVVEFIRKTITQAVASELDARIPLALVKMTGHLQSSIAQMLTTFLDAKPGESVQAPAETAAIVIPADVLRPVPHETRLPLLDVVGLIGPQINQVRDNLNGHASSVRFVDADHVDSWKPRGVVILNTKFIGHNAENKCKKAGVKPIRVNGGAEAVMHALNELWSSQHSGAFVPARAAPH